MISARAAMAHAVSALTPYTDKLCRCSFCGAYDDRFKISVDKASNQSPWYRTYTACVDCYDPDKHIIPCQVAPWECSRDCPHGGENPRRDCYWSEWQAQKLQRGKP